MRTLLAVMFVAVFAAHANGQAVAYAEGGPAGFSNVAGRWPNTFHVAAGGEGIVAGRLGVGGEIGFFQRVITASGNATFHLTLPSSSKASAFITGGYTRFGILDGEGGFNAWNIGAGAHFWLNDSAGLRVELRNHVRLDRRGVTQHWSVRAGVVVR